MLDAPVFWLGRENNDATEDAAAVSCKMRGKKRKKTKILVTQGLEKSGEMHLTGGRERDTNVQKRVAGGCGIDREKKQKDSLWPTQPSG